MAVRHQPIPYPWCWSSCVFCFSCFEHTLPQSFLSVPCSRVVTILQTIWPMLWSCMILATCARESHACFPSSRPRRILWAAGGRRCLVVVGPCRVVLGALPVGRGASARVLALFSDSSAFIAFAISSSLSPRVCSVKLSSSSSRSLSESDSLDVVSSSVMEESLPLWVIRACSCLDSFSNLSTPSPLHSFLCYL